MTLTELEQRIAKAVVDLWAKRASELPEDKTAVDAIARIANVPEGHVIQFFESWGVSVNWGNPILTPTKLKMMEAHVIMPVEASPAFQSQHFNVNAGQGSQVQVGNTVSGNQSMVVTYGYILEQLKNEIERSSMADEEKKSALDRLGNLLDSPVVAALLNLGAKMIGTGSP